ncbi:hypothetical protein DAPPUDRAFT_233993 [Daphnia pulex]|uniref:Uncharacterized protein n=1 Tax=Daphnia pulex TaxID=6669 RepID=E9FUA7_DAPPU|nr:hypothetical protein DAPPUDRAFT_233993 [Daphnia pulex]|eukprot:EFX88953.1 hypothetical protein DAPPUDRAFT_233993 [Daphnia pulex]
MRLALSVLVVLLAYVAAQEQPQYVVYRSPYQAPYYGDSVINPEDPRLFLPTTTTTSTSTSTVTCTKSTATACTGRRRRGLLFDGEEDEQFPIVPTAVEGVEPTQASSRDARAADPQLFIVSPQLAYQPQSTFRSGTFNYRPVAVPFYGTHGQPVADERLFFTQIQSALTVTKTATAFAIFTSTSTPACSAAGTIAQCPNA